MALEASEFAPEDYISTMPDNVITSILHQLPLQDAVRTGILSRNWRFKWTMLTQLKFNEEFFVYLMKTKGENSLGKIISRLLLHLNGAVTKSVLVPALLDVEDIHHLILFLSRKGIKDLTITDWSKPQVKLPTHLFSCLELKRLNIYGFCFHPPPGFHGFPSLLCLELRGVQYGGSDLGEFLARCPLLEILDLRYLSYTGNVKLVEIAKLVNLKILSLSLCHLETTTTISPCNVFELVGFLPKLQELGLDFQDCRVRLGCVFEVYFTETWSLFHYLITKNIQSKMPFSSLMFGQFCDFRLKLTEDGVTKKLPTAFPALKALKLTRMDFGNGIMLSFALEMLTHFPNLQTLDIIATRQVTDPFPNSIPIPEVEYNMMELRSVLFGNFKGSKNEVYLIKYFLACSPSLKKIEIQCDWCLEPVEQLIHARKLLMLHRASPLAEIEFY